MIFCENACDAMIYNNAVTGVDDIRKYVSGRLATSTFCGDLFVFCCRCKYQVDCENRDHHRRTGQNGAVFVEVRFVTQLEISPPHLQKKFFRHLFQMKKIDKLSRIT